MQDFKILCKKCGDEAALQEDFDENADGVRQYLLNAVCIKCENSEAITL